MIQDLKDLKALFKLCRNQGVTEIKLQGVEIKFGDLPRDESLSTAEQVQEEEMTTEDLLFYSSGGPREEAM